MHRRDLLRTAPFLLAGSLGSHSAAPVGRSETEGVSRMRIAICAYSFRTPLGSKALTYADLVHMAVEQEIDGLDLTVYWFPNTKDDFLLPLKRLAYRNAVEIYSISIRTNLCRPTPQEQARELQEIRRWIEVAHRLGAGHIRIFGGDAPPGASLDQAAGWAASVLGRAAEESGKRGVILGLENHGGITARAETMIGILEKVDSPWAGINLDTGNFLQDPYGH
ncbi:MAG: sugar phosphate isomerase/epimerase, partial [Acidobacteria bacterium]|nr:sugar phosphate isomerase/epimerase [Acidobacteriota bacterium]